MAGERKKGKKKQGTGRNRAWSDSFMVQVFPSPSTTMAIDIYAESNHYTQTPDITPFS
jgi:hypothetical protein